MRSRMSAFGSKPDIGQPMPPISILSLSEACRKAGTRLTLPVNFRPQPLRINFHAQGACNDGAYSAVLELDGGRETAPHGPFLAN